MGNTILKYSALLIATYLVVSFGTNSGRLITDGSAGSVGVIKAFQGR
jgi:hypothetical protein